MQYPISGGPNDIVIPATCPCFTVEDIEEAMAADPNTACEAFYGLTSITNEACTFAQCYNSYSSDVFYHFEAEQTPMDAGWCQYTTPLPYAESPNWCSTTDGGNVNGITEDEGTACVAIIETLLP